MTIYPLPPSNSVEFIACRGMTPYGYSETLEDIPRSMPLAELLEMFRLKTFTTVTTSDRTAYTRMSAGTGWRAIKS